MKAPEIIVYAPHGTTAAPIPAGMAYAAAMVPRGPGTHWLATGATPEEARAKLEDMWRRQFPPKRPGPKRTSKSDAPPRYVVEEEPVL